MKEGSGKNIQYNAGTTSPELLPKPVSSSHMQCPFAEKWSLMVTFDPGAPIKSSLNYQVTKKKHDLYGSRLSNARDNVSEMMITWNSNVKAVRMDIVRVDTEAGSATH